MNGKTVEASTRLGGGLTGAVLWFYLPRQGRFVVSLLPHPNLGFFRVGEVSDMVLTFTQGADQYRIESTRRIAPGTGRFHVYVQHDGSWRPAGDFATAPLLMGGADRPEYVIAK